MPYPEQLQPISELVKNGHAAMEDEPLLVAVYYTSRLVEEDKECLFEIARHFGFDEISEEQEIFQIQFGTSSGLRLPANRRLRLLLTNPREFETALKNKWPQIQDLQEAIAREEYKILYVRQNDSEAANLRDMLQRVPVVR